MAQIISRPAQLRNLILWKAAFRQVINENHTHKVNDLLWTEYNRMKGLIHKQVCDYCGHPTLVSNEIRIDYFVICPACYKELMN